MSKVQFIKTTGGEELAVLPKSEYERLAALATDEDAGTVRLVRKARAAVEAGHEVLLPKAVVDRLAAGENPIRVLREWRDETQAILAHRLSITQGYLSDLEAGKRKGTVELHQRIARALGVPIDLLLPIAVSRKEANSEKFARDKRYVHELRKRRGFK
ncbi:MAG: helix-turn-helix transcriptional regulator [Xanthobacteraceae bacterium]